MSILNAAIIENLTLWNAYLDQSFLKDLRHHSLREDTFVHYLQEDTKYLKDYARVFGMGIYKSETMEEILLFYEMLKFVESNESAVRVRMLEERGFSVSTVERDPQQEATKNYTSFLLETAQQGSILDILFATLPCMLSYAYIGKLLLEENPNIIQESPYGAWIEEYTCEAYREKCKLWSAYADRLCANADELQQQHLFALFQRASEHERNFWEMSYHTKG